MRTSYTAVIERNTEIRDGFVSEGYECGWASEALLFLRVLDGDLAGASARIQISPDGMHWCDEGSSFPLASANQVAFAKIRHFGNWLRFCIQSGAEKEGRILATLHLKE